MRRAGRTVSPSTFSATPSGSRSIAIRVAAMATPPARISVVCLRVRILREKGRSEETSLTFLRLVCATNAAVRPTSSKNVGPGGRERRPILADASIDYYRKSVEAIKKFLFDLRNKAPLRLIYFLRVNNSSRDKSRYFKTGEALTGKRKPSPHKAFGAPFAEP